MPRWPIWSISYFSCFLGSLDSFVTAVLLLAVSVGAEPEGALACNAKGAVSATRRHTSECRETMVFNCRNPRVREVKRMAHLPRASILQRNHGQGSRKFYQQK